MCRALKVLCAAPGRERLDELKRAAVSAHWELAGGAASLPELAGQLEQWRPDVVVLEGDLGPAAVGLCRAARPGARIVVVRAVAPAEGADATIDSLEDVRAAILGVPRPGGPVGARPVREPPRTP